MKFDKRPRYAPPEFSSRAKSMFANKPKRDRKKLDQKIPLFAEQVELQNNLTVEQEEERRYANFIKWEQEDRNRAAKKWRAVRAMYFKCTPEQREKIKARWNAWRNKRNDTNLMYLIELENGDDARRREAIAQENLRIRNIVLSSLVNQISQSSLFGGAA